MTENSAENKDTLQQEMKSTTAPTGNPTPGNNTVSSASSGVDNTKNTIPASPSPLKTIPPRKLPGKGKKLGPGFFLGCFGLLAFLFVLFVVMSVLSFSINPNSSFLGVNPIQTKQIVSSLVNISFGIFSLIILIALVVHIFRRVMTKKEDKERRKKATRGIFLFTAVLFMDVVIWIFVATILEHVQQTAMSSGIIALDSTGKPISTLNIDVPKEITFSAENIRKQIERDGGKIISYVWDINGDGLYTENKTGESVTWQYENRVTSNGNGQFTVKVKVTYVDNKGVIQTKEIPKVVSIASILPHVVLQTDVDHGGAPLTVHFDASQTTDPDAQDPKKYLTFAWDFHNNQKFEDGNTAIIQHTFETEGTFPVFLKVTGQNGKPIIVQKDIVVSGKNTPLTADIKASPLVGYAPLFVHFTAEGSKTSAKRIVQYSWDFGDGSLPEKGMTITHQYVKPGTFHVTLTVIDDQNQQASNSLDILVQGKTAAPQIVLKTDPAYSAKTLKKVITGNVPLTVHFDASATTDKDNDIVDYQWDLDGNGTFETGGSKADYTYNDAGERTVTLKVTDAAKNESLDTVVITTLKQPLAAIIQTDVRSGIAPLKVSFDASASRYDQGTIEQYQWDFNDGTPPKMYNAKIQYTFAQPGIYHVKLTVFTNDGKKASTTQDIIVSNVPLIARYTPSIKEGKAPLSVTFDPSSSTGAIVSFFWDFGDGVVSNERQPTHTFEKPGTYTVLLRVQDKDNITDEYTDQITVD